MKSFSSVVLFVLVFSLLAKAQVSTEKPLKSESLMDLESVDFIKLPEIDVEKALEEDAIESKKKDVAQRFGIPIILNMDFFRECQSTTLGNGNYMHRLAIAAPGAKSLNLTFSSFYMPENAWMHVYSPDKKELLGAFTSGNNKENGIFATVPIFDDSLIIEVFGPEGFNEGIVLESVVYGYRNWKSGPEQFGSSGSCNINVACPEGNNYREQIRSIVMLLTGANNRLCSGALINNVEEDGTPYVLTANHCPVGTNNIAIFNYQSSTCTPSKDTSLSQSINGLKIRASNGTSDFLLTELSITPPSSYNVIYSGWDNTGVTPRKTVGIHHPSGDVKKISVDNKSAKSSGYYTSGNDHWMVEYWDKGTTEVISSGSPLFDKDRRIVGQLHGGDASCTSTSEEDYYGKFSLSWNLENDSANQLKHWLDPKNRGAKINSAYNPQKGSPTNDVAIMGITNLQNPYCGVDSIQLEILFKNRGTSVRNNLFIEYFLNNSIFYTESVAVQLSQGDFYTHLPNKFYVEDGIYDLKIRVEVGDENYENSVYSTEISVVKNPINVELTLQTDDDGNETSWELMSSSNYLLASGGGYASKPGGELIMDTFCLYDGCFEFNIYDEYGDGICCDFGNGYYVLRNIDNGDTLVKGFDFKGADSSHFFCLGDSCSIRAKMFITDATLNINDGTIETEVVSGIPPFKYLWSNGDTTSYIINQFKNTYWVRIEDSMGCADTIYGEIDWSLGLKESENPLNEIKIFPNPSNGQLTIDGLPVNDDYKMIVCDLRGMKLTERNCHHSERVLLDLQELSNGMYLVRIMGKDNSKTFRIVVRK